jgi:DinB superfamily
MSSLTDAERKRVYDYLADAGDRVLSATHALTPAQLRFRPRHDRWSIAENIEHLAIVDKLVLSQVIEVVAMEVQCKQGAWRGRDEALLELVRRREPVMKAPELISPSGDAEPGEIALRFDAGRRQIAEFIKSTSSPLRSYCFPHPVFGEMDCYQWLLCSGGHYERHLLQINEVMKATDFPPAQA